MFCVLCCDLSKILCFAFCVVFWMLCVVFYFEFWFLFWMSCVVVLCLLSCFVFTLCFALTGHRRVVLSSLAQKYLLEYLKMRLKLDEAIANEVNPLPYVCMRNSPLTQILFSLDYLSESLLLSSTIMCIVIEAAL